MSEILHSCGQKVVETLGVCPHCESPVYLLCDGQLTCLERYRVGARVLEDVGPGRLYEATSVESGTPLFVREIVPRDPGNLQVLKKLGHHARALRSPAAPLVCRVESSWIENGRLYLATSSELSLSATLMNRYIGGCRHDEAEEVVVRVLDAVSRLHALDPPVIHGDVGWDTVFETPSGDIAFSIPVTIGDLALNAGAGRNGGEAGWPRHAPLERRRQEHSPATDVFGAGLLFLELISSKDRELLCRDGRLDAAWNTFELDGDLEKAIGKLLEPDPARRPPDAHAAVKTIRSRKAICARCGKQPPVPKRDLCEGCDRAVLEEKTSDALVALASAGVLSTAKEEELRKALKDEGHSPDDIRGALKAALDRSDIVRERDVPAIQVTPQSLRITAVVGEEGKAAITVSNAAGGSPEYRFETNRGYLNVAPDRGVAKAGSARKHWVRGKWTAPVGGPETPVDDGLLVVLISGATQISIPVTFVVSPAVVSQPVTSPADVSPPATEETKPRREPQREPPRDVVTEELLVRAAKLVVADRKANRLAVGRALAISDADSRRVLEILAARGICEHPPGERVFATSAWVSSRAIPGQPLPNYVRPKSSTAGSIVGTLALLAVIVVTLQGIRNCAQGGRQKASTGTRDVITPPVGIDRGPPQGGPTSQSAAGARRVADGAPSVPESVDVRITTDPPDATLEVPGVPHSQAGVAFRVPLNVAREIRVSRPGYAAVRLTVVPNRRAPVERSVKLEIDAAVSLLGLWDSPESSFDGKHWSLRVSDQTPTDAGWNLVANAHVDLGEGESFDFELLGSLNASARTLEFRSTDWTLQGTFHNVSGRPRLMSGTATNNSNAADIRNWSIRR